MINKAKKMLLSLSTMITVLLMCELPVFAVKTGTNFNENFNAFMEEYKLILTIVCSLMLFVSIIVFIYHCVSLNKYSDSPQKRKDVINNLLISGVCLAIQGSISLIIYVLYTIFI